MTLAPIISSTATQNGYGSGRHLVCGLTAHEQQSAVAGERVFYRAARASQKGPRGTFWRVVKAWGGQWYPRVPTMVEIDVLRAATGVS
jgi:hypothetical protein